MSIENSNNGRGKEIDFRSMIARELKRQEKSVTWLAQQGGCPHRNSIYRFLRKERDVRSASLAAMLRALGLHMIGQYGK
jgi:DNA-binding phage protein